MATVAELETRLIELEEKVAGLENKVDAIDEAVDELENSSGGEPFGYIPNESTDSTEEVTENG